MFFTVLMLSILKFFLFLDKKVNILSNFNPAILNYFRISVFV